MLRVANAEAAAADRVPVEVPVERVVEREVTVAPEGTPAGWPGKWPVLLSALHHHHDVPGSDTNLNAIGFEVSLHCSELDILKDRVGTPLPQVLPQMFWAHI